MVSCESRPGDSLPMASVSFSAIADLLRRSRKERLARAPEGSMLLPHCPASRARGPGPRHFTGFPAGSRRLGETGPVSDSSRTDAAVETPQASVTSPMVDVRALHVRFGSVDAVLGVDLEAYAGQATAL